MTHKEKRVFFNWLHKHDALKKYRHNRHVFLKSYHSQRWRRITISYSDMLITEVLGIAFSWSETPEGGQYWHNLDNKWLDEYRNII